MKLVILINLACATVAFAADPQPQQVKSSDPVARQLKKLGAVTWQPDTHKLTWVVQKGTIVDGEFVAVSEERYEVSPEEAFMALREERRGIDGEEAVSLHRLLDTLAMYCAQSVAWWDNGGGVKPDGTKEPSKMPKTEPAPGAKIVRAATAPSTQRHKVAEKNR
jgi:hypothetical protein